MTEQARNQADTVQELAGFQNRQDLYRLAIAAALRKGLSPTPDGESRTTYLNVGSLDPDGAIRSAIVQIREDHGGRPYALAGRLAEAGIADMHTHFERGRSIREYLQPMSEQEPEE